jgi:putative hydrolase of the HAD superfamily
VAIARIDPSRVEALVYDMGNVLVEIDFGRVIARWAHLAGVPAEALAPRFAHGAAYEAHERGEIDAAAYYASLRKDLGVDLDDAALEDGWNAVFGPPIAATVERVHRMAPVLPQYLFSNTNAVHHAYWSRIYGPSLAPFRAHFVSHRMGKRKPERASFEHVAREIGVPIERVLFLDDLPLNVEGARDAGMQAVVVRSPRDVAQALQPWLGEAPTGS